MYQLGIIINGKRTLLWEQINFPPFGTHDMLAATVKAIQAAFPEAQVTSFQLHNGQSYSH